MRHGFLVVYWHNNKVENIFDNESDSVTSAFLRFEDNYGIENFPLINIIQIK
jgi:hypothetical protein